MRRVWWFVWLLGLGMSTGALAQGAEWVVHEDVGAFRSSVIDLHGRVWMGGAGLSMFNGKEWQDLSSNLPQGSVTDLALDLEGNVWVGVANEHIGGGLVTIDASDPEILAWSYQFRNHYVYLVAPDSAGRIWMASREPKLGHPEPLLMREHETEEWEINDPFNFPLSDSAYFFSTFEPGPDSDEPVWAVLHFVFPNPPDIPAYQLYKYENDMWQFEEVVPLGDEDSFTREMVVDARSNLWISTWGEGLLKYDGETFTVFNTANSPIPSDTVEALALEQGETIWASTPEGLVKFDGSAWNVYDLGHLNLPPHFIYTLSIDSYGNKWMGMRCDFSFGTPCRNDVLVFREGGVVNLDADDWSEIPQPHLSLNNFPNPFHSSTQITYDLPHPGHTTLAVYDLLGREVAVLADYWHTAGTHEITFHVDDLASGVYLVRLQTEVTQNLKTIIHHE